MWLKTKELSILDKVSFKKAKETHCAASLCCLWPKKSGLFLVCQNAVGHEFIFSSYRKISEFIPE
jgi:hypothetical protein